MFIKQIKSEIDVYFTRNTYINMTKLWDKVKGVIDLAMLKPVNIHHQCSCQDQWKCQDFHNAYDNTEIAELL